MTEKKIKKNPKKIIDSGFEFMYGGDVLLYAYNDMVTFGKVWWLMKIGKPKPSQKILELKLPSNIKKDILNDIDIVLSNHREVTAKNNQTLANIRGNVTLENNGQEVTLFLNGNLMVDMDNYTPEEITQFLGG